MCNKAIAYRIHLLPNTTTSLQSTSKKTYWHQDPKFQPFTTDSVFPLIVTTSRGFSSLTTVHNQLKEAPLTERKASPSRKVSMKRFLTGDIPFSMKGKLILMGMRRILSFDPFCVFTFIDFFSFVSLIIDFCR